MYGDVGESIGYVSSSELGVRVENEVAHPTELGSGHPDRGWRYLSAVGAQTTREQRFKHDHDLDKYSRSYLFDRGNHNVNSARHNISLNSPDHPFKQPPAGG